MVSMIMMIILNINYNNDDNQNRIDSDNNYTSWVSGKSLKPSPQITGS